MGRNSSNYRKYFLNIIVLYKQRRDLKTYLELLLSIAAIAIFMVFAIKPTIITITDLITKINTEQVTSDALDIKIKNLGIAQSTFNQNQDGINLLSQAIPNGPDVASYVRQLQGVAAKESAQIISLTVSQTDLSNKVGSGSAQMITTTVTASGDYGNLQNFIKDVESLRRPAIIENINLVAESSGTLDLTFSPKAAYNQ
ncbi:hypothetical protein BH10PAT1_BH10PAT1_1930 [soil metagenome]